MWPHEDDGEKLIEEVKALGHYPRESKSDVRECNLARKLRQAIKRGVLQPAQLQDLEDFRTQSVHPVDRARSSQLLEEAEQPAEPMEGFLRAFVRGPIVEVVNVFFLSAFSGDLFCYVYAYAYAYVYVHVYVYVYACICLCICMCICIYHIYIYMYMYIYI